MPAITTAGGIKRAWLDADLALHRMHDATAGMRPTEHPEDEKILKQMQDALFVQVGITGPASDQATKVFEHIDHMADEVAKIAMQTEEINDEDARGAKELFMMLMTFAFGVAVGRRQSAP